MLLKLDGRIDTDTAPILQKCLNMELEGITELILDMKNLEYLSSAALRVLLAASKKMDREKGSMTVINVGQKVWEIFRITGFDKILKIERCSDEE